MTRSPSEKVQLPIYEDLVRERGDAVAEAQLAAELLARQDAAHPAFHRDAQARAAAGDQPEWRGALPSSPCGYGRPGRPRPSAVGDPRPARTELMTLVRREVSAKSPSATLVAVTARKVYDLPPGSLRR